MGYRSVLYRNQIEAGGGKRAPLSLEEGIATVKKLASMKADRSYKNGKKRKETDHTVELVMHLGIDPKHADQMIRGAISLPKGIGKARTVIAFCDGPVVEEAKEAGALEAGGEELVAKIQEVYGEFARQSTYKDRARDLEAFIGHVRNRGRK